MNADAMTGDPSKHHVSRKVRKAAHYRASCKLLAACGGNCWRRLLSWCAYCRVYRGLALLLRLYDRGNWGRRQRHDPKSPQRLHRFHGVDGAMLVMRLAHTMKPSACLINLVISGASTRDGMARAMPPPCDRSAGGSDRRVS